MAHEHGHRLLVSHSLPFGHDLEIFGRSTIALRAGRELVAEVAAAGDVPLVDLTSAVCPDGVCAPLRGDTWVFRDGGHISVRTAHELTESIQAGLAGALGRG